METTLCKCGHGEGSHYNAKDTATRGERTPGLRRPCRFGKHDMRCACRDFAPNDEQRRPTREDRRHRMFDRDGRPMWVSVPA